MSLTHVFAGNPLDRADTRRRDPQWLEQAYRHPQSRVLPFWQLNVLLDTAQDARLGWLAGTDLARLALDEPPVLLGLRDDVAHFALDVSSLGDPAHELDLDETLTFQDARSDATVLRIADTGILAQSRSQIDWHRRRRFCSTCGEPTTPSRGGHLRQCAACGAEHFPRTDPVAIMLIVDGERCLLGRSASRLARSGMYSALAGFIDHGESIEEAVRREVLEEAGANVGEVRYHSSQPWPFPSSLMIGRHGKARSTDISMDAAEMADVPWFDRNDVRVALTGRHASLKVPGPMAIAHHLIRSWTMDEVRF